MRQRWVVVLAAGAVAVMAAGCAKATPSTTTPAPSTAPVSTPATAVPAAVRPAGSWGRAIEVPGLGALNVGKDGRPGAGVTSVACGSAGNCVAGGNYQDQNRHSQGFVVNETNGHWGMAIEVPGMAALNAGRYAEVTAVYCASAGNCAAGGD
ncbi:MAG: hypothetical protein LBV34_08165, partial [Nocardiopsaceae bacterium]|nr:hypothetical protein [Nocardiopsaceae bacterium]